MKVINKRYVLPNGTGMQMGCHHEPGASNRPLRACGGCYARVIDVLKRVQKGEPLELISQLWAESKAEGRAIKRRRARAQP